MPRWRIPALRPCGQPILADGIVRYVGEPIAAVLGRNARRRRGRRGGGQSSTTSRCQPVPDAEAAVAVSAPLLHPHLGDNLAGHLRGPRRRPRRRFAAADRIVSGRFYVQRYTGMPLETRGVAAVWDAGREHLTLWSSTQWPHTAARVAVGPAGAARASRSASSRPTSAAASASSRTSTPKKSSLALLARRLGRPGEVGRDAPRAPVHRRPRARAVARHAARGARRRHDPGHARRRPVRPGRLHAQPGHSVPVADRGRTAGPVSLPQLRLPTCAWR